jgi:hypothetical protein
MSRFFRKVLIYLISVAIGSLAVWYFWLGNRTDLPSFWPAGKVKEKILSAPLKLDSVGLCYATCFGIVDSTFRQFVHSGKVRFGLSETRRKPFPVYILDGRFDAGSQVRLYIESGDDFCAILKAEDLPGNHIKHTCSCKEGAY